MSIFCSKAKAFKAGKSVALMDTFSPTALVPALPGAIKSFSTFGLWAIFHARACSRPPLPNNNTFIFIFLLIVITYFLNTLQNNGLSFHADAPGHVP